MSSMTCAPAGLFTESSTRACDRVLHFDGSGLPAEIAALGEAEQIYSPNPVAFKLAGWRHLLAVLMVAVIGGLFALVFVGLAQRGQLDQLADPTVWVVFAIIGASAVGAAIWLTMLKRTTATVFFYRQAAVVADGDRLMLIPWQHLLWLPGKILTPEGDVFHCGWMQDHDRFEEAIWALSEEFWVPAALKKIQAGQAVPCGDLSISASGITWKGKTAAWEDIARLVIIVGRAYRLNIATKGSWIDWASIDLHQVPNARAIERLISQLAPDRLLKNAE